MCRADHQICGTIAFTAICLLLILALALAPFSTGRAAQAAEDGMYRTAAGFSVYLDSIAAEVVRGHPRSHAEPKMYDGVQAGESLLHIVAAIFDGATGKRLADLGVRDAALGPGWFHIEKPLGPMTTDKATTYGNYFALPEKGDIATWWKLRAPLRLGGLWRIDPYVRPN